MNTSTETLVALPIRRVWGHVAALIAMMGIVLWALGDTAAAMVDIWWRSETFTHAFLVPPISLWLIWRRRHVLTGLALRPLPAMVLLLGAACVLWLLGEAAAVGAASQFALVTILILCVPAVLGWALTREIAFPLGFLLFAVPLGEFLVPTMIDYTADFTVAALRLTGIPVYREGNDFVIPSGNWSVIDACSGVRYLIASVMVGTLFAYLNYRSVVRRLTFVGVAILVPIVANWLRAYMIVMIGHLSDNRLAVGVDHILYGWVFFGVVIGLMFLIGARWTEPEDLTRPVALLGGPGPGSMSQAWMVAVAGAAIVIATQAWWGQIEQRIAAAAVPTLALPAQLARDWVEDSTQDLGWQPSWAEPSATDSRSYRHGDRAVWLWVGYYRQQGGARKLVASTNRLAGNAGSGWVETGASQRVIVLANEPLTLRIGDLRQATSLTGAYPKRLRVWQVYWVDGRFTASGPVAKIWQALAALQGRGDDGAVILMAVPLGEQADKSLDEFARAILPPMAERLAAVRDAR